MATAGTLEILLLANVARLQSDVTQAKNVVGKGMQSIQSSVSMAKRALGALGIGIGLVGFGRMIKGALEAQDALSKLSQKLNVSVESLAGYQHAAQLAGVNNESLTKAFKTLSSQMFDASSGLAESKRNFSALGIEVKNTDGTLKDADKVMLQVADRFAGMKDGAAKSALAVKLFGKAGLDMIPMLNEGRAAIEAMIAEGQRLNPVTAESAKQAEIFNDNMSRLGKSMMTVVTNILNDLLPALSKTAKLFADAALSADGFWKSAIGWAFTSGPEADNPAKAIDTITDSLGKQRKMLGEMEKSWASWFNADDIAILKAGIAANEAKLTYLRNLRRADPGQTDPGHIAPITPRESLTIAPAVAEAESAYKSMHKTLSEMLLTESERTEVAKLQMTLDAMKAKERAKFKPGEEAALKRLAEEVDLHKQKLAQIENDAKNEEALSKMRQEGADAMAEHEKMRGDAILAADKQIEQMEFETKLIGATNVEREKAISLRAMETEKIDAQTIARMQEAIAARNAAVEIHASQVDMWRSIESAGHQAFLSIFDTSKDVLTRIKDMLKTHLLDILYQVTIKKWLVQIAVGTSGAGVAQSAIGATGSALGSAGSGIAGNAISSMIGNSGITSLFGTGVGGLGGAFGSGIMTAAPVYEAGALVSAGSSASLFSSAGASAAMAAIPVWGWAALAAAAAYYVLSDDDGDAQRTGTWAGAFGQGTKSTSNRWFSDAEMGATLAQFSADLQQNEQNIKELLNLNSTQIEVIDTKLAALAGKQYGFGMEHTDWLQSGAPQAIAADRLNAIAEALGTTIEGLAKTLEDAQKVIELAPQKLQLEIDLMKLQGKAAEALAAERKRELAETDPLLHSLRMQIYAEQDLALAAEEAADAVSALVDQMSDLLTETQSAVNEQIGHARSAAQAARAAAESFRQVGEALAAAVAAIMGGGRAGAAGRLEAMFGTAMTGDIAALSALPQAGQDFLAESLKTSRTSLEFARDQAKVVIMLQKAQVVADAMVDWNEYQATLMELQIGVLETIRDQLALPSPDAAILTQQMEMLGTIAGLLEEQTMQIVSGNGMQAVLMHDQTGKIILANTLTTDQTGQIALGNSWLGAQTGAIVSAATVAQAQSGQIAGAVVSGNALTAQQITQLSAANAGQGIIQSLLNGQTAQIIGGNLVLKDQSGLILSSNALLRDQAGELSLGNSLVGTQTGQIITGNATQDVIKNITALNTSYSEQQLKALVESGVTQGSLLSQMQLGISNTVILLQQLITLMAQANTAAQVASDQAAAERAAALRAAEDAAALAQATAAFEASKSIVDALRATRDAAVANLGAVQTAAFTQEDLLRGIAGGYDYFTYWLGQESLVEAAKKANIAYMAAVAEAYELWMAIPGHASGGMASGWSMVGEYGPELVDFASPGRVYTAEQTRDMMGGASNDELVTEIRSLRSEVSSMRRDTRKTADTLEAVANGQLSFSTEAA